MSYLINITYNDLPARMGGILVQNVTCFGNRGAEADAQVRHDVEMIVSCVDPGAIFFSVSAVTNAESLLRVASCCRFRGCNLTEIKIECVSEMTR